jgi:hypothetical protein
MDITGNAMDPACSGNSVIPLLAGLLSCSLAGPLGLPALGRSRCGALFQRVPQPDPDLGDSGPNLRSSHPTLSLKSLVPYDTVPGKLAVLADQSNESIYHLLATHPQPISFSPSTSNSSTHSRLASLRFPSSHLESSSTSVAQSRPCLPLTLPPSRCLTCCHGDRPREPIIEISKRQVVFAPQSRDSAD